MRAWQHVLGRLHPPRKRTQAVEPLEAFFALPEVPALARVSLAPPGSAAATAWPPSPPPPLGPHPRHCPHSPQPGSPAPTFLASSVAVPFPASPAAAALLALSAALRTVWGRRPSWARPRSLAGPPPLLPPPLPALSSAHAIAPPLVALLARVALAPAAVAIVVAVTAVAIVAVEAVVVVAIVGVAAPFLLVLAAQAPSLALAPVVIARPRVPPRHCGQALAEAGGLVDRGQGQARSRRARERRSPRSQGEGTARGVCWGTAAE